jgi:hypothetical protein
MQAVKTKALVNEKGQIDLLGTNLNLEKGVVVEVIILYQKPVTAKKNWKKILGAVGTYTKKDLSGFFEAKKEIDNWKPAEF